MYRQKILIRRHWEGINMRKVIEEGGKGGGVGMELGWKVCISYIFDDHLSLT